jgi:UDP-N-acetyl-D-mannosaminuronic acid dehydrogenase
MAQAPAKSDIDVTIIGGAGHVGLPLALAFAETGMKVLIQDLNEVGMRTIASGVLPFTEYGAEPLLKDALAKKRLAFSTKTEDIPIGGTLVITIGTPVDEFLNPVYDAVIDCMEALLPQITDSTLLVLRSTVYPGTTDWLDRYLRGRGKKPLIAFCPERVVQGYASQEIHEVPQIVSGTSPQAVERARALFAPLNDKLVTMIPKEAEFAKLFSNAYRYIHFAIANELYMIATSAGVDYHRIMDGMTQDYPRAKSIPRPGFTAGPCLFKDTMQLAAFSKNQFGLGHAAMLVNEGLVLYVVDAIRRNHKIEDMTVGILGMAFKADIDDTRASLSYKMKNTLKMHAKKVLTTDPFVTTDEELRPVDEVLRESDLLVLCTPHTDYKGLDLGNKPVIDIWRFIGDGQL